jgi:Xaa-Pro aminopeptidase
MTRIEKLRNQLPGDFGAAMMLNPYNRGYLTEFFSSAGVLLVTQKNAWLIMDFRYIESAKTYAKEVECILMDAAYEQTLALLCQHGIKQLYLEDSMPLSTLSEIQHKMPGLTFHTDETLTKAISRLRAVKEPAEIAAIKCAQAITDAAFEYILGFIKPGQTERQVAAELEYFMRNNGADGTAFSTICVAGVKSSMPHGVPGENVLKKGDFLTMDYGAMKDGYCSDMTRTVAIGSVTDEQKRVYATVLKAHLSAQQAAKPGMSGRALDKVARDIIYQAGFEGCFGHGLGHSLGLEVHENPRASAVYEGQLQAGNIMTIEPGIYLEGRFGVRIENMIVLTETGSENLTRSPRELIVL